MLNLGVRCLPKHAKEIVLDLDSRGHLAHGLQEGRPFSAYYDGSCYLPLYVICDEVVLWAQLRTADQDGAAGVVPALEKIVAAIRRRCRKARIIVHGDSGFGREDLMAWGEGQREVYYALGLSQNSRLLALADETLDLHADRLSTHDLGSNQWRLWLATLADLLLERLRALTLQGTQRANATAGTIRQQHKTPADVAGDAPVAQALHRSPIRKFPPPRLGTADSRRHRGSSFGRFAPHGRRRSRAFT